MKDQSRAGPIACTTCGLTLVGTAFDNSHSCFPAGTRVRLTKAALDHMTEGDNTNEHAAEFRGQIGTVIGHAEKNWPEIDVMWDSRLRYCYPFTFLEVVTDA